MRNRYLPLFLLLLVLAGAAAGALVWLGGEGAGASPLLTVREEGRTAAGTEAAPGGGGREAETEASPGPGTAFADSPRVVVWPLKVELELLEPQDLPRVEGVPLAGSGATAAIRGTLRGIDGQGVAGSVEFLDGSNRGRILACDADGSFGASNLYPGISIVRAEIPGTPGAEREVLLRQGKRADFNVNFARPAAVYGEVLDTDGEPLAGARVELDGQQATTDELGEFYFPRVAPGKALAVVTLPGYAHYREELRLQGGAVIPRGKIRFFLERGASLRVFTKPPIGARSEALLFLTPANWMSARPNQSGQRSYPWYRVSPTKVFPGGTAVIEDLPPGRVNVRLFHAGVEPVMRSAVLRAGQEATLEVQLKPMPTVRGVVLRGENPVEGASVAIEAPDRVQATLKALGEPYSFLETGVLPHFPPAVQVARTDRNGRFELAPSEEAASHRYLRVLGPDGSEEATRVVKPGEREVTVRLSPRKEPDGLCRIELPGRDLPLDVDLWIQGKPYRQTLAPDEPLLVGNLQRGVWKITVSWDVEELTVDQWIDVTPKAELTFHLPQGALEGQVLEEQVRAGKR